MSSQTHSPLTILRNKMNLVRNTELFEFSPIEYMFSHGNRSSIQIMRLILSKKFEMIDLEKEYSIIKNKKMYKTPGEFFLLISLKKIFDCYTREEMTGWVNIFIYLSERIVLTPRINSRIKEYISQERMPRLLRCVVLIILERTLFRYKNKIMSILTNFPPGVDNLITLYAI